MRVRLFAGGPGLGHISRMEAVAEVLEERGHGWTLHHQDGDVYSNRTAWGEPEGWWVVDDYEWRWSTPLPPGVRTVHVDDFNKPHPDATIHWVPIGERALVRRAFRVDPQPDRTVGTMVDATKLHGFSAESMAEHFRGAVCVRTTASVKAWEALTCGAKVDLLPPNDNQRLAYEAIKSGVTTDGRGALRLVERMDDAW